MPPKNRKPSRPNMVPVSSELEGLELPDKHAELEALYRFFNNDGVTFDALLAPHAKKTAERVALAGTALVVHDTTEMEFKGEARRKDLGILRPRAQGFLLHVSLAVSADGNRRPLGVLAAQTLTRQKIRPKHATGRRLSGSEYAHVKVKESSRWAEGVRDVEQIVGGDARLIHVMDREADAYPLLHELVSGGHAFVIRASRDHRVFIEDDPDPAMLTEALMDAPDLVTLEVPVSKRRAIRAPRAKRAFGDRKARLAKLRVSAITVQQRCPSYLSGFAESLRGCLVGQAAQACS